MLIDALFLLCLAAITWCVASEGPWGAGMTLIIVIVSGLLAMNFFEPFASRIQGSATIHSNWGQRVDFIALVGLFALFVFLLRMAAEYYQPTFMEVNALVYDLGRWAFALLTGYVACSFLLAAFHTAPLPPDALGFTPEVARRRGPVSKLAPDMQWLGFTQYVSEKVLKRGDLRVFDGPKFELGDYPNDRWAAYPIRYAARRRAIAAGGAAAGQPAGGGLQRREPKTDNPGF